MINGFEILYGTKDFSSGIFLNYLLFVSVKEYLKFFTWFTQIYLWKSNGMLEESIENITKSDSLFFALTFDNHMLPDVNFNGYFKK